MRLRLLVPRRGRGRGLGGLSPAPPPPGGSSSPPARPSPGRRTVLAIAALAAIALLLGAALIGRATAPGDDAPGARAAPARSSADGAAPAGPARDRLDVGLDVSTPDDLTPPAAGVPPGIGLQRSVASGIAPRQVRIVVRWDLVQPRKDRPLDPAAVTQDGCGRGGVAPCGQPVSLDGLFRALADARRAHPGRYRPLITFWGMPSWAGTAGSGCDAAGVRPGARPLAPGAVGAYRAAIRRVWDAGRRAGVPIDDWTPWNEPNAPYFISPQRAACEATARPVAPAAYVRMATAMDAELGALPGRQRLVLGELATWGRPSAGAVPADEFLRALPSRLLCRADALALHGYVEEDPPAGTGDPLGAALVEIGRRGCLAGRPVWITETGTGAPHGGAKRDTRAATLRAECALLDVQLERWWRDPRIAAAFQYSVREDSAFPAGLASEALGRAYPVADLWRAWGGARDPTAAPPALPASCVDESSRARDEAPPG